MSAKRLKFRRLAEARTTRAIDSIRKVGNLSSPNYEFDESEVEKIFAAIHKAAEDAHASFRRRSKKFPFAL